MNTFGNLLRLTTFGESHGPFIGGVLDGFPAGFRPDFEKITWFNALRRPGSTPLGTERNEEDVAEFISGFSEGLTNGTPIAFLIKNKDQRPSDYNQIKGVFRPSHADYVYWKKYGIKLAPGGGRASARETAARVTAGGLALQWLSEKKVTILAWTEQIGSINFPEPHQNPSLESVFEQPTRCPSPEISTLMQNLVQECREKGDSIGGIIRCRVDNVPPGLGEPIYGKLSAQLSNAIFSINAVKGLDFGAGFLGVEKCASELNDLFETREGKIVTKTNNSGGIQGGISNGMPISFRVLFKPPATISKALTTVNEKLETEIIQAKGRHDPCVVPRAVPVVMAMTALTIMDSWLLHQSRYNFV